MTQEEKIEHLAKAIMTLSELGDNKTAYVLNEIRLEMKNQLELSDGLEEEIKRMVYDVVYDLDGPAIMGTSEYLSVEDIAAIARHFAEWRARHSINWGDVQLLDTFILELSREEKDGADWGESEKFYTEVLRRFHEFNDKKIPGIVAELGAEHLKK